MRRVAGWLLLSGSMVTAIGLIEPSGPASAQQVKKARAQKAAMPVNQADLFIQQFGPQFKQLHKSELHFMRTICQPTKEQFARIQADTEPALKETIKEF